MTDTEKITINMSVVDLGQIDLLVGEGFYSSRTDFIRTAIRNLLGTHAPQVKELVTHKSFTVGITEYGRKHLEKLRTEGVQLDISAMGLCIIENDVSLELARAVIKSLTVRGVFRASDAVKEALSDRMK
jgi:Arc/MetJ-type ribon-helix-helix transcriptional regulator